MKYKMVKIFCCHQCPYYYATGWGAEICNNKGERINVETGDSVPDWCPLPDTESPATAEYRDGTAEVVDAKD